MVVKGEESRDLPEGHSCAARNAGLQSGAVVGAPLRGRSRCASSNDGLSGVMADARFIGTFSTPAARYRASRTDQTPTLFVASSMVKLAIPPGVLEENRESPRREFLETGEGECHR